PLRQFTEAHLDRRDGACIGAEPVPDAAYAVYHVRDAVDEPQHAVLGAHGAAAPAADAGLDVDLRMLVERLVGDAFLRRLNLGGDAGALGFFDLPLPGAEQTEEDRDEYENGGNDEEVQLRPLASLPSRRPISAGGGRMTRSETHPAPPQPTSVSPA